MKKLIKIGMLASMGLTLAAISCQKKDSVKNEATESRENENLRSWRINIMKLILNIVL